MCGIAGVFSKKKKPVGQLVYEVYQAQRKRGSDGFGFVAIKDGHVESVQRSRHEYEIRNKLRQSKADVIMFHHRLPTSTKNTVGTAHPILVKHNELKHDYYVAHNGIITNHVTLKKSHEELGYVYTTEFTETTMLEYKTGKSETFAIGETKYNDSESLAIELARYIEGLTDKVGTYGAAAFWVVQLEKNTDKVVNIFYGNNKGRDLCVFNNKKYHGFASEKGTDIESMKLYSHCFADGILYEEELKMNEFSKPATNVGYSRTRTEVTEQVNAMSNYLKLENKYYSKREVDDTGVPISEFIAVTRDRVTYYLPLKFMGKEANRTNQLYLLPGVEDDTEVEVVIDGEVQPSAKVLSTLEDLCEKIAKAERVVDELDSMYDNGTISAPVRDKAVRKQDNIIQECQEKISALNLSEDLVEEHLEIIREMHDYNSTYPRTFSEQMELID